VLGVLVWAGDYLTSGGRGGGGGGDGSSRRLLGVVLSLVVVAAGYVLALRARRGPLNTAGVVASALGVPVLIGFLTFDAGSRGLPFSLDALALISVIAWLASYLVVPGTRGHAVYLGLAAITLWFYVLDKAEPKVYTAGFLQFFGGSFFADIRGPDWNTVALLSLFFGLAYYAVAFVLDRLGRTGPGAALAVGGFLATAAGSAAAAVNLPPIAEGVMLIVLGAILAGFGARGARRFTTWAWSAGVALGVVVIIGKLADQNSAAAGVALIVSGAVLVVLAHFLAGVLHEPDDLVPSAASVASVGDGRLP